MTTENQSVLEKLKRLTELQSLPDEDIGLEMDELFALTDWYMRLLPIELIAALELVGAKAKEQTIDEIYGEDCSTVCVSDGEIDFAREVLAVVNGER